MKKDLTLYDLELMYKGVFDYSTIWNNYEENVCVYVDNTKDKDEKKIYNLAQDILYNQIDIDHFSTLEDKTYAIFKWVDEHFKYDFFGEGLCYHALLYNKGVCNEFSFSAEYLCYWAGIDCVLVHNDKRDHQWNAVKASNGKWYFIDAILCRCSFETLYKGYNDPNFHKDPAIQDFFDSKYGGKYASYEDVPNDILQKYLYQSSSEVEFSTLYVRVTIQRNELGYIPCDELNPKINK